MTSPPRHKAVPALLALLLLLTLAACSSAYSGTNSETLSGLTLQPAAVPSIEVAGTVQVGCKWSVSRLRYQALLQRCNRFCNLE
jgi:hypothetical protein